MEMQEEQLQSIAGYCSAIFSAWGKEPRDVLSLNDPVRQIYEAVDNNCSVIQQVIEISVCPILIEIMRDYSDSHAELVVNVASVIIDITSGSGEQTQYILNIGALPVLKQLLLNPNKDINDRAVWCLANIAGQSLANRDLVIALGVHDIFLTFLLQNEDAELKGNTLWAISMLFRGIPKRPWAEVLPYLPTVAAFLRADESALIIEEALRLIKNILEGAGAYMENVETNFPDLANNVVSCLHKADSRALVDAALDLVEVVVTESPAQKQELMNAGIIQGLSHVIVRYRDRRVIAKATKVFVFLMIDSITRLEVLWRLVDGVFEIPKFRFVPAHHEGLPLMVVDDRRAEMCCKIYSDFIDAANHDQLLEVMNALPLPVVLTYFIFTRKKLNAVVVSPMTVIDRLFNKIGINSCFDRVSKSACERLLPNPLLDQVIPRLLLRNVGKEPIDWINLLLAYGFDISQNSPYIQDRIRDLNVLTLLVSPTVIARRRKPLWLSRDIWRLFVKFVVVPRRPFFF